MDKVNTTTPAELIEDVLEERGRLYWETVNKYVESIVDEWKRLKPDIEKTLDTLQSACAGYIHRTCTINSFEAFAILQHTKHPLAIASGPLGGSGVLKEAFNSGSCFPWKALAFNAFYADCEQSVLERLSGEFAKAEMFPNGHG